MTRTEFDNITEWYELIEVCDKYRCDILNDVYSSDSMDEAICDSISESIKIVTWSTVRDLISDIPRYREECYYRRNSDYNWDMLSEHDFINYKKRVKEWMENNYLFG